jgi:hypothetical protein
MFNEPPDAERHVRWCEGTGSKIIVTFPLDLCASRLQKMKINFPLDAYNIDRLINGGEVPPQFYFHIIQ